MIRRLEDCRQHSCNKADGASEAVNWVLLSREVYDFAITDEQLQDLVCLFIWSAAIFEGADLEGCDDDLDLPPFQLEQLKRKCAEGALQGPHAMSEDGELASLAEDIGIVEEELHILSRYCSWTSTLAARCSTLSAAQLGQLRTRCEAQGLTCSWTGLCEGMINDCKVSDERLQNLMRFYNWRYSTCGCMELDDELGLPDEHFDELTQYFSWCESRAITKARTTASRQATSSSLTQELAAPEGMPPVPESSCIIEACSTDENCAVSFLSKDIDRNGQPMDPLDVGDNGDERVPAQTAHTDAALGTHLGSLSFASALSEEIKCISPWGVGRPIIQTAGDRMPQVRSSLDTPPPQPLRSTSKGSVDSLPSSFENASKMMEPVEDTDISARACSMNFLSSLPKLDLPLLGPAPCLTLPGGAAHPSAKDGAGLAFGRLCVPLPANSSESQQQLKPATLGQSADNNPSPVPSRRPGIAVGSPDMLSGSRRFTWRALLEGWVPPKPGSPARRQAHPYDDCSEDLQTKAPNSSGTMPCAFPSWNRPSPPPCTKAKTFCGASPPADVWGWPPASWQDDNVGWSSWWPSILHGFKCQQSCHEEAVHVLRRPSEDLHVDH